MFPAILDLTSTQLAAAEPDEYIRALMRWHFGEETGSPFWLRRARSLDFDPIADVRTYADLSLFPNVVDEFREVAVEDLVPRGLRGEDRAVAGVFESGGTTGAPKRFVMFERWAEFALGWDEFHYSGLGTANLLAVAPSGPHMFGDFAQRRARRQNGLKFTVDLDPRWIKQLIARGAMDEVERYTEHLVDQAAHIMTTQSVGILVTTPPLLERIARREELVERIRKDVRFICWSGAHMDADSRDIFRREIFPGIPLKGLYGSTTVLGMSRERPWQDADDPDGPVGPDLAAELDAPAVFDPPSPYITFQVVDPETRAEVAVGERGQVVMNHLTRYALIPNNLERDLARRVEPLPGTLGCAVSDVAPVSTFGSQTVIEGVY
ncbi:phenazine antibiotic biosynthesis protein [Frankia sp. CcI49]|uniref:AMP-binding protein n=1 Tax=unclassified Frankia TaxID=2632575 RepID=UPI0006CA47C1|nr:MULTISPECIES: AMP-binding protein [unclassified Frankia]KPM54254.1 phenazine antibiotic biosynthesis protein [Frankia sp. R43]ONH61680.1 phenazine antibiotic biosynthesis protein [Frankia sp. CcI49]